MIPAPSDGVLRQDRLVHDEPNLIPSRAHPDAETTGDELNRGDRSRDVHEGSGE